MWLRRLAYVVAVGVFAWICAQYYIGGLGLTGLVHFGDKQARNYLPELRAARFYLEKDSFGYDAQYYAQIAMHPRLDHALSEAVDNLPYRARRILFCWTAYVFGAGQPTWALQVYAAQNLVAWFLLAWVLLRWFPPTNWGNFFRWFAVMFTYGLGFSVRGALVDGPSLLLIAIGMALLESGRSWWSAAVLGVAGLGKETNLLAAAALAPDNPRDSRQWRTAAARLLIAAAPLAVWLIWLDLRLGEPSNSGARNFDWPLVGYIHKWREVLAPLSGGGVIDTATVCAMVGITVQLLFFVVRLRWREAWWRVGAGYAALMIVLGDAVWEGFPGAAPRVLLPMTLAFNIALPRGRRWWALLVLGNLLVWPSFDVLKPPAVDSFRLTGPHDLCVNDVSRDSVAVQFPSTDWYGLERSYFDYWEWAGRSAKVILHNPQPFPIVADLTFALKTPDRREITVRTAEHVYWREQTLPSRPDIVMQGVVLPPGDTPLYFETDRPALRGPRGDARTFAFRVCHFSITVVARAE